MPRESHFVVVGSSSTKDENQDADLDDQKGVSHYPLVCAGNVPKPDAPPLLRGRGSLLDTAIFMTSCGKMGGEEDQLIRSNAHACQYLPTNQCHNSTEDLAIQKTTQLACRTDANTKKFAYQTFVDAGLLLGRTVTDCTALSKDVYRLNSSKAHRQRDDDLDFFLHESGNYEEEALNVTLRSSEQLVRSPPHARPIGVDYSAAIQHKPPRTCNDFHSAADSSQFAQLLHRAYADKIPLLPRETKSATVDTFRPQYSDKPSWDVDGERKTSSRAAIAEHQHVEGASIRGHGIRLSPKKTIAGLRLPHKVNVDILHDAQRCQLNDRRDYKNPIHENILYGLPDIVGRDLQTYTEQTLTIYGESNRIDDEIKSSDRNFAEGADRDDNRGKDHNATNVPLELASLRGEIGKLRTQIAEARVARFITDTDKVEAILGRDRYHTEVRELKTRASKVEQQEREIRDQMDIDAHAREMEAKKLRLELDEVRSFLEQKKSG